MKAGDLVKVRADRCKTYGRKIDNAGIVIEGPNKYGLSGAWVLWSGESIPRLFGRLDFLEVINESR